MKYFALRYFIKQNNNVLQISIKYFKQNRNPPWLLFLSLMLIHIPRINTNLFTNPMLFEN